MKILTTFDDRDSAEEALNKIAGDKKIVSDREDNQVIYKLFGNPTWSNFYKLGMFNLIELQSLLEVKKLGQAYDQNRHKEIISMLKYSVNSFDIDIPSHWL